MIYIGLEFILQLFEKKVRFYVLPFSFFPIKQYILKSGGKDEEMN
jgi:hypothetical protein